MRTRIALVDCYICGRQDYGPEGAPACLTCIAEESHCTRCTGPGVTITLYTDYSFTMDIEHAVVARPREPTLPSQALPASRRSRQAGRLVASQVMPYAVVILPSHCPPAGTDAC